MALSRLRRRGSSLRATVRGWQAGYAHQRICCHLMPPLPPPSGPGGSTTTASEAETETAVDVSRYTTKLAQGATLVKRQSSRLHLLREPSGALKWAFLGSGDVNSGTDNGYAAQIARTTDAGLTWQTVFSNFDAYYFNGIECASAQDCCAVAEDAGPPYNNASDVGTYIFCTTDGGNTWVDTFRDMDTAASLIDIAALSPLEYWAVGAELGKLGPKAPSFYHTTDGGASWTQGTASSDLADTYAIAIDCVAGGLVLFEGWCVLAKRWKTKHRACYATLLMDCAGVNCWANVLDILTQESSVAILNNGTRR